MKLEHSFQVQAPLETVWSRLIDVEQVAPCLPGAEITEHGADSVKGRINVRFGPMRAAFNGAATLDRTEATKSGSIRGAGQDSLSSSRARGDISYRLIESGPASTKILLSIDYSLQGPLAQFSRGGLVKEFVANMVAQFGANLDRKLAGGEASRAQIDAGGVFWRWLKGLFFK